VTFLQIDRKADKETHRQTGRQTDMHTETDRDRQAGALPKYERD